MTTTALAASSIAAAPVPAVATRSHRAMLDVARLLAAYGIVWLHAVRSDTLARWQALGRFAVPFFVFAAVFFVFEGLRRQPARNFAGYARSRFVRLYLPFLAWSGIYLVFKAAKAAVLPEQPNVFPGLSILWVGSFYHLWFIPFVMVVSLVAFLTAKVTLGRPGLEQCVAVAALGEGLLLALMPSSAGGLLAQGYGRLVADALPAACWAVALAILLRHPAMQYVERSAASVAALALAAVCTVWTWQAGSVRLAGTLAGLGFMIAALGPMPGAWMGRLTRLGPLAYGIYFSHLLWIKVFEAAAARLGWDVCWQLDLASFAASAVLSTLLAWALSRWRWTRWLVV